MEGLDVIFYGLVGLIFAPVVSFFRVVMTGELRPVIRFTGAMIIVCVLTFLTFGILARLSISSSFTITLTKFSMVGFFTGLGSILGWLFAALLMKLFSRYW